MQAPIFQIYFQESMTGKDDETIIRFSKGVGVERMVPKEQSWS
jgi:hypothetical protein